MTAAATGDLIASPNRDGIGFRRDSDATPVLLDLTSVGKDYAKVNKSGRVRLVWNLLLGHRAAHIFRALDDVSLRLARGDSLGIIGDNGAGKSTLLKIVAGVIQPTRGSVRVAGRVGALLELGSGFHPEYSGLANIDLAAALLGLSSSEIDAKREAIIEFADLGDHIDDPIKQYSSGMVVRLGFAIATALEPDILITDEVLAVGDESFQKRCVAWLERFLAGNGTLLLCSHSMYHIQKLCRMALWLKDGRIASYGAVDDVVQAYLGYHEEKERARRSVIPMPVAMASGMYAIQSLELSSSEVRRGEDLAVRGEIFSPDDRPPVIVVGIGHINGTAVYGVGSDMDDVKVMRLAHQRFAFALTFLSLPLQPGKYVVRAHAADPEGIRVFDHVEQPLVVRGSSREFGLVHLTHRWHDGAER